MIVLIMAFKSIFAKMCFSCNGVEPTRINFANDIETMLDACWNDIDGSVINLSNQK